MLDNQNEFHTREKIEENSDHRYDIIFEGATIYDGALGPEYLGDVAVQGDKIVAIGDLSDGSSKTRINLRGKCLAPGFIDVHTHDDLHVLKNPMMLCKVSQGVTTVIVGNCGISASPVIVRDELPDPMNLLGDKSQFVFNSFQEYAHTVDQCAPSVNVAALVGHTSLRNNTMDDLNKPATKQEVAVMTTQLHNAMEDGALGLSSGLAYSSAIAAPIEEVVSLAKILNKFGGIYTTHLRNEFDEILPAMKEVFLVGKSSSIPVVISHFKCAGAGNWGNTVETVKLLEQTARFQDVSCDCYPYSASSSTLDLGQVTDEFPIFITWSDPHPEQSKKMLKDIADDWGVSLKECARRLQPAGAVYHNMLEEDVRRVLQYKESMIGSDGLPVDPHPHPRLWGTFPRVIGHYAREMKLFDISTAIWKMTGLPSRKFGLRNRGEIKVGNFADLVIFDADQIGDSATYESPTLKASGICSVWVNGIKTYEDSESKEGRSGRFLRRDVKSNENIK